MAPKFLALDLAVKTGWATPDASGVWHFKIKSDESRGMRLIRLKAKLLEFTASIHLVALEMPASVEGRQGALTIQAEMLGIVKLWCEEYEIDYCTYTPTEIKKWATGKGNASKETMMTAAQERWPNTTIEDHNQADALWMLDLLLKEYGALYS